MSDDITNDIVEARLRRAQAQQAYTETEQYRVTVEPFWRRVIGRRVDNGFGEEYDLSIVPKVPRRAS